MTFKLVHHGYSLPEEQRPEELVFFAPWLPDKLMLVSVNLTGVPHMTRISHLPQQKSLDTVYYTKTLVLCLTACYWK